MATFCRADEIAVRSWFDHYRDAFGPDGRGESEDLSGVLAHFRVPLPVTTDDAADALTSEEDVEGFLRLVVGVCAERTTTEPR